MAITIDVLEEVICPTCGIALVPESASLPRSKAHLPEVVACTLCGTRYYVSTSIVSFISDLGDQKRTASGFGFEWNAFWKGLFDKGDVFGLNFRDTAQYFLSCTSLRHEDLDGLRILDAGTGSGRIPISLRDSKCEVYAVDIHESLESVARQFMDNPRIYCFRADLLRLPFKDSYFDVGWSSGVIHHTPNPAKAFASIARTIRPGGRLFISVYGTDLHHYRLFRRLLPFARHMPASLTFLLSALLAVPLYLAFNAALALVRVQHSHQLPPYRFFVFTIENIEYKSYRSILLNLFDQLHPQYQSEHSVEEVQRWFTDNGFEQMVVVESVGMVGIRGTKKTKSQEPSVKI